MLNFPRFQHRTIFAWMSVAVLALATPLASAQHYKVPNLVRGPQAENISADPSAVAHFGCELRAFTAVPCYGPDAIRAAYGIDKAIAKGFTGAGETIVIIDAYGSPTLELDLQKFDAVFGLPAPPSLQQIHMPGSTPFNNQDGNQLGWAEESSLDVQWAHAIAPGANIILVAAVSNNDNDMLDAQNFAIDNRLGHIISESFGESELALLQDGAEGAQILADNEASYKRAVERKISVFVSAGDSGAAATDINGNVPPTPTAQYPASSPNVTSVGGTNLFFGIGGNANPNGAYIGEVVWNDGFGAGGGGISGTFRTPNFQRDRLTKALVNTFGGHRAYPDVAYNAGVRGGVIVSLSMLPQFPAGAFFIFGGTSASAPQWAGLTGIANQMRGEPVGNINDKVYKLGKKGVLKSVLHDVTVGDNGFAGVPGFPATVGFDLSTGWGTPNDGFLQALIGDDAD